MRLSRNVARRSITGRLRTNANAGSRLALTDIEPRLRKVMGYRHLPKLREALKRELKIETAKKNTSRKNVA